MSESTVNGPDDTTPRKELPMDALIILIAVFIGIALFDLVAVAFGAESRDGFDDEHPYPLSA
jgi:hypothetical protein